jgi:hypothetical protein
MTQDVSWPKASEGGKVVGKEEIRGYWTRQWGEFDPHVEPLAMTEEDGGRLASECTNSSRAFKVMSFRTARFFTCSLRRAVSSQAWTSGMKPMQPLVRLPHSPIDPNWLSAVA